MTTMIAEVYDALRDAGVGDDKARRAAEALASNTSRFDQLDAKIDRVEAALNAKIDRVEAALNARIDRLEATLNAKIDRIEATLRGEIAGVKAELVLMRWMMGTTLALVVAILVKLFIH